MTRKQAHALGKHKYSTGKPCIRGHKTFRYVNTGVCIDCAATYSKNYQNRYSKSPKPEITEVKLTLRSEKDRAALMKYADALNFDRELQEISEGKF
jgi:hypothetical protein